MPEKDEYEDKRKYLAQALKQHGIVNNPKTLKQKLTDKAVK
jgi:hypothetical protein